MVPDWLSRAVAAKRAPAVGVALLALAAVAQAAAQFAVAGSQHAPGGAVQAVFGPLPVCLLALAATVPLLFLRPAAAAITIAAANALLLAGLGMATVAGVLAQLIAAYRVGAAEPRPARDPRWVNKTGSTSAADGLGVTSRRGLADAAGTAGDVVSGGVAWPAAGYGACPAPGR